MTVTAGAEPREVDARPSDALNLAVRTGAAIHVTRDVFDTAGLTTDWLAPHEPEGGAGASPPWTRLSAMRPAPRSPSYVIDAESPAMLCRAATEAQQLGHRIVMLPHLLLGILAAKEDPAARLLARHGLQLEPVRAAVDGIVAQGQRAPETGEPTRLGPRATFAMHRASTEARRREASGPEPMQLLLAVLESPDVRNVPGIADLDVDAVRAEVRAVLGD